MKTRSLFGVKSITNLIYGLIILLPMFAVLGRVIYTQSNPNAKDSYSSKTIYQQFAITNISQFPTNQVVNLKYKTDIPDVAFYTITGVSYISYTAEDLNISQVNYDSINTIRFYKNANNQELRFNSGSSNIKTLTWDNSIDFNFMASNVPSQEGIFSFTYISQVILVLDNLDNAFEFSLKTFVDDNNLGSVDLFGWFTDLFINQSNSHNALYLNFINWYLNYTLLVSSGYLIFLALIWFINYVRKILDKSMYHDFGGF